MIKKQVLSIVAAVTVATLAGVVHAQSPSEYALIKRPFFQNPLIWKLTKGVAYQTWGKNLMARPLSSAQSYVMSPDYTLYSAVACIADQEWDRILYFETLDNWIRAYSSHGAGDCQVFWPMSIEVAAAANEVSGSTYYHAFVLDYMNNRIIRPSFHWPSQVWVCSPPIAEGVLNRPRDLDLNDNGTHLPVSDDYLWVISDRYQIKRILITGSLMSSLDAHGCDGAVGTFCRLAAIVSGRDCLAAEPYSNTNDFYVADVGNNRLVWLRKSATGETLGWYAAVPISATIADLEVDQFGHVWTADSATGTITKYTANLVPLCTFGSTGIGERQFIQPLSMSTTGGYLGCANMAVIEAWTDSSGGQHFATGTDVLDLETTNSSWNHMHTVSFTLIDWSRVHVKVFSQTGQLVKTLFGGGLVSGQSVFVWDGSNNAGEQQPTGDYRVQVLDSSTVRNIATQLPLNIVTRELWLHHDFNCCTLRGDFNSDGLIAVSDLNLLTAFVFQGGSAPACFEHADVDADGQIAVSDETLLIAFLFRGGAAPAACF